MCGKSRSFAQRERPRLTIKAQTLLVFLLPIVPTSHRLPITTAYVLRTLLVPRTTVALTSRGLGPSKCLVELTSMEATLAFNPRIVSKPVHMLARSMQHVLLPLSLVKTDLAVATSRAQRLVLISMRKSMVCAKCWFPTTTANV